MSVIDDGWNAFVVGLGGVGARDQRTLDAVFTGYLAGVSVAHRVHVATDADADERRVGLAEHIAALDAANIDAAIALGMDPALAQEACAAMPPAPRKVEKLDKEPKKK